MYGPSGAPDRSVPAQVDADDVVGTRQAVHLRRPHLAIEAQRVQQDERRQPCSAVLAPGDVSPYAADVPQPGGHAGAVPPMAGRGDGVVGRQGLVSDGVVG